VLGRTSPFNTTLSTRPRLSMIPRSRASGMEPIIGVAV
jgi:hypothetical protein